MILKPCRNRDFLLLIAHIWFSAQGMNMRGDTESGRQSTADLQSSAVENLSEASIRKQLRSGAVQHPATLIPLAVAGLSLIHLIGISPFPIGAFWAIIVLIGSLAAGSGSFFLIYSIRHDAAYAKLVQEIMAQQGHESREASQAEVQQMRENLRTGLTAIGSTSGLKALTDLDYEYEQLQLVLDRQDETTSMSIAHIPGLAEETYREGLNVLENGLHLSRAIHTSNKGSLEAEIVQIEEEIETLKKDDRQARRVKIREETVASHRERLEMIDQQQFRVDELLYQCDRCEASLSRTRIELASLQAGSSDSSVSAVTETLRRTITQAKEVQEEMRRLGF